MQIKIHHTGSRGNLCQVGDLLVDPGVSIDRIRKALNFKLSGIKGCLCSHAHADHSKAAKDIMKAGIDLYCHQETALALDLSGHRLHIALHMKQFKAGDYKIVPFELIHDVDNLGFLIGKGEDKVFYATDTNYIPYRFKGLTHIILGVDYDRDILKRNVRRKAKDISVAKRTLKNHMSLTTALEFFQANDMSKVREIYLVHLSDSNSDERKFKADVEKITGRPVYFG